MTTGDAVALWIGVGLLLWVVVALGVALVVGRAVALRERQVPRPDVLPPAGAVPGPRRRDLTGGAGRSAPAPRR